MKNENKSFSLVATLTAINSRIDRNGNCYWAFTFVDHATGKTVCGKVSGGESNIRSIIFELNGGSWEPRNVQFLTQELPIREFNKLTKKWAYGGCTGKELVEYVHENLAN